MNSVAFSPDGDRVLTGSDDGTARLWSLETGETLQSFAGHSRPVFSVAFSPDGARVLTGSGDGTARLWSLETGETLQSFAGHSGFVSSVAFSPDSARVLTGSRDGTARLWPVPAIMLADPAEQVQIACRMLEDIGFTAFSEEDLLDHPILRTPLIEAPCEDHWRPGAQEDLATE